MKKSYDDNLLSSKSRSYFRGLKTFKVLKYLHLVQLNGFNSLLQTCIT